MLKSFGDLQHRFSSILKTFGDPPHRFSNILKPFSDLLNRCIHLETYAVIPVEAFIRLKTRNWRQSIHAVMRKCNHVASNR